MPFTLRNLREDLADLGSNFDGAPDRPRQPEEATGFPDREPK
jgi:hypothetical protein